MDNNFDYMGYGYEQRTPAYAVKAADAIQQINTHWNELVSLGFAEEFILDVLYCINRTAHCDGGTLKDAFGPVNGPLASYMLSIANDAVALDGFENMAKHYKKLACGMKFGIQANTFHIDIDAEHSERRALVNNIPQSEFSIYNGETVRAEKITPTRIEFKTTKIPVLPYKHSQELYAVKDGSTGNTLAVSDLSKLPRKLRESELTESTKILSIQKVDSKTALVTLHRDYTKLLGRFCVIVTLRLPQEYIKLSKIVALDGTKIYVLMRNAGYREKIRYSSNIDQVLAYGFQSDNPDMVFERATQYVANKAKARYVETVDGYVTFEEYENSKDTDDETIDTFMSDCETF